MNKSRMSMNKSTSVKKKLLALTVEDVWFMLDGKTWRPWTEMNQRKRGLSQALANSQPVHSCGSYNRTSSEPKGWLALGWAREVFKKQGMSKEGLWISGFVTLIKCLSKAFTIHCPHWFGSVTNSEFVCGFEFCFFFFPKNVSYCEFFVHNSTCIL